MSGRAKLWRFNARSFFHNNRRRHRRRRRVRCVSFWFLAFRPKNKEFSCLIVFPVFCPFGVVLISTRFFLQTECQNEKCLPSTCCQPLVMSSSYTLVYENDLRHDLCPNDLFSVERYPYFSWSQWNYLTILLFVRRISLVWKIWKLFTVLILCANYNQCKWKWTIFFSQQNLLQKWTWRTFNISVKHNLRILNSIFFSIKPYFGSCVK